MSSYHGWTHRPKAQGGTDPIPGAAAAASMWPVQATLLDPVREVDIGYETQNGPWTAAFTPAVTDPPFGWYITNNSDADNELFCYARLGPQGSMWAPVFAALKGPDCGKFDLSMQLVPETTPNSMGFTDPTGMIASFGGYTSAPTLYYPDAAGSNAWTYDLYQGGAAYVYEGLDKVRLMGADGAPITANATLDVDSNYAFDGGAGIYCIRIRTTGKNASSSSYKIRFGYLAMARITDAFDNA